jgi:hypothetical protein
MDLDAEAITNHVFEQLRDAGIHLSPMMASSGGKRAMSMTINGTFDKEFATSGSQAVLTIYHFSGRVRVQAGEEPAIRVRATDFDEDGDHPPFSYSQDGNQLTIRTDSGPHGPADVNLEVIVPYGSDVRIHTHDGDISVRGVEGPLRAETVSGSIQAANVYDALAVNSVDGDVQIDGVRGACTVTAVSGDIQARGIVGELQATANDGDVTVTGCHLAGCAVSSTSGDVRIETALTAGGHYTISTNDGDASLVIPPDAGATMQLTTVGGDLDIRCGGLAEMISQDKHTWRARIGDGSATVAMHSTNGDLSIVVAGVAASAHPASPVPPVQPDPPARPSTAAAGPGRDDRTVGILAELERGEISVEEAMRRLDEQ